MRSSFCGASSRGLYRPAFETLEERIVLSGTPPTVTAVEVAGTDWSQDYLDYLADEALGEEGYAIPAGSDQLDPLPFNNLNQIKIAFSENVQIDAADLSISNTRYAVGFTDFQYDAQSYVATWTLNINLESEKYFLDLDADGLDPVVDNDANVLDGEWTDESSTFSSGDGQAGGDFEFRFNVLVGDVTQNGHVTSKDYVRTRQLDGETTEDADYDPLKDIDGSGTINSDDYTDVWAHFSDMLPSGDPIGLSGDAPTTSGFEDVQTEEDAVDIVLDLWHAFDDAEDADDELTYSVVNYYDLVDLFDTWIIDTQTGELTLDLKDNAYGEVDVVIQAMDTDGLIVETAVHVDVASVNDAPVISNFQGEETPGNFWVFTGTVTDVDGDPTGWIVNLYGVIPDATTTVDSYGNFSYVVQLPPGTVGDALAQTEDDEEEPSNVASYFVLNIT